jgi:hypothetical protein
MTSELMAMVSKKQLYKVVGIAIHPEAGVHVDEGRLYAAHSEEEAVELSQKFWTEQMRFTSYNGYAKLIDRVDGYKIVLVDDGMEA